MFKKKENLNKEKKVRTVKIGTHKKTVIALWVRDYLFPDSPFGLPDSTANFIISYLSETLNIL